MRPQQNSMQQNNFCFNTLTVDPNTQLEGRFNLPLQAHTSIGNDWHSVVNYIAMRVDSARFWIRNDA